MYVIAVYDVAAERTPKMLKLCRRYLHWIQNSVFEGEISEVRLKELITEAQLIMDESYDSFIIFKNRHVHWLDKQLIGKPLSQTDQFI
ncbi:MAG: CRISPR-associated endonuclease Cas2 [Lewinellaceae bacterium]|nr:CRISPR-associated endonuclease Cas2 [Phaeodactylibacter sp.]MCB9039468.1 CRISPR-associated endonuclease Cas2 [Lewinellaceae bacterium]